jgi:hypothetical protein
MPPIGSGHQRYSVPEVVPELMLIPLAHSLEEVVFRVVYVNTLVASVLEAGTPLQASASRSTQTSLTQSYRHWHGAEHDMHPA